MSENHHDSVQRNLLITLILNVIITIAQIFGGIVSGSLALISDALHNLSDSLSVVLTWAANLLSRKPKTTRSSFGFQRAEILAAFINGLILVAISGYLSIEAIHRFIHFQQVDPKWMFWLGLLGLMANGLSVIILHGISRENINLKAAYLHLLGDAFTSIAVILGAVAIHTLGWYWVDPLVTLLISGYLFVQTFTILKEAIEILMQMSPSGLDTHKVGEAISNLEGIHGVHHIHIWKLSDKRIHFEAHIELDHDLPVSATHEIRKKIREKVRTEFGIEHTTLQFEFRIRDIARHEHDCG
jgi:cobalt-zinc-cadmium efflux system protein